MTFNISEENWLEDNGHVVLYIETGKQRVDVGFVLRLNEDSKYGSI
jgi:hypothetical protein